MQAAVNIDLTIHVHLTGYVRGVPLYRDDDVGGLVQGGGVAGEAEPVAGEPVGQQEPQAEGEGGQRVQDHAAQETPTVALLRLGAGGQV